MKSTGHVLDSRSRMHATQFVQVTQRFCPSEKTLKMQYSIRVLPVLTNSQCYLPEAQSSLLYSTQYSPLLYTYIALALHNTHNRSLHCIGWNSTQLSHVPSPSCAAPVAGTKHPMLLPLHSSIHFVSSLFGSVRFVSFRCVAHRPKPIIPLLTSRTRAPVKQ